MSTNPSKRNPRRLSRRNFNIHIMKYYDKYCWGYSENGVKQYRHNIDYINNVSYKSYIKLQEKPHPDAKKRDICLQDHLEKDSGIFIHGNANIFSPVVCLHGDIDPVNGYGYKECEQAVYYLKQRFFPNLYWERSTNGEGIAFFVFIDFTTFPFFCRINNEFRENCNYIISNMSLLFTILIDSMFFCHFDKFCGEYPSYSFSPFTLISRDNMGRIPCPSSDEQFLHLYHCSVNPLSHAQLDAIFNEIYELLPKVTNSSEHTDSVRSHSQNTVWLENTTPSLSYPHNTLGQNPLPLSPNGEGIVTLNPLTRCRMSMQILARELGRMPDSYEEWNTFYEAIGWNTGEATPKRRERYNYVFPYVEKGFDITACGNNRYHTAGRYMALVKKLIPQDALDEFNNGHANKVRYEDLDMAVGYTGFVLCDQGIDNIGTNYELTIQQNGIVKWVNDRAEKGECKRKMNRVIAGRVFALLQQYGLIERIEEHIIPWWDEDHHVITKGRARRYVLTDKHPDYYRFLELYGVCIKDKYRTVTTEGK